LDISCEDILKHLHII